MNDKDLQGIALALVAPGKGILAADESTPTITKRLDTVELPSTEETRRAYRQMLLTTPGLGDFISGVILFDETIRQKTNDGTPFPEALRQQGIIPGIKVDKGTSALANSPEDRKSTRLNSSHVAISYAVFCLKKKKKKIIQTEYS